MSGGILADQNNVGRALEEELRVIISMAIRLLKAHIGAYIE